MNWKKIDRSVPTPGIVRAAFLLGSSLTSPRPPGSLIAHVARLNAEAAGALPWKDGLEFAVEAGWLATSQEEVWPSKFLFFSPHDMLRAYLVARPAPWFLLARLEGDCLRLPPGYGDLPETDCDALVSWGVLEADGFTVPLGFVELWQEILSAADAIIGGRRVEDNGWEDAEEAVVRAERERLISNGFERLASFVTRVSLISDRFGYDVRSYVGRSQGSDAEQELHLEVKFSRAASTARFRCFLTRHEFRVGTEDSRWLMALCDSGLKPRFLPRKIFRALEFPIDGKAARWTDAELTLDLGAVVKAPDEAL